MIKATVKNEINEWILLMVTISLALILTLLPMPAWFQAFRPAWALLVMVFWALLLPGRLSITLAWVVGLLMDVLNGTLLGEHPFALTLIVYFVARMKNQLLMFSLFQQGLAVFFLVLVYLFMLFCIQGFLGYFPNTWFYWLPAVTSMLLWPWVSIILKDWYARFAEVS